MSLLLPLSEKGFSIRRAVDAVKIKKLMQWVSAGNSGVAMASALFVRTNQRCWIGLQLQRQCLHLALFVLIDAGANVDCKAENLVLFGLMGSSYCKAIFGKREPKVALLSIGEEDVKGNELTREAFKLLKGTNLNFIGNIEGKDVFPAMLMWWSATGL